MKLKIGNPDDYVIVKRGDNIAFQELIDKIDLFWKNE